MSRPMSAAHPVAVSPPSPLSPLFFLPACLPAFNCLIIFYAKWAICCRYKAHSVHFHCYYCAPLSCSTLLFLFLCTVCSPSLSLSLLVCCSYFSCMHINFDASPSPESTATATAELTANLHATRPSAIGGRVSNLWTLSKVSAVRLSWPNVFALPYIYPRPQCCAGVGCSRGN